jgi:hypothetical protein
MGGGSGYVVIVIVVVAVPEMILFPLQFLEPTDAHEGLTIILLLHLLGFGARWASQDWVKLSKEEKKKGHQTYHV